ncbi:MAG: ChaN family lipoprotein [Flavobacteriales bacterium]|nr:ChaN family lipoprotein [Flavobacteriales bacterium]
MLPAQTGPVHVLYDGQGKRVDDRKVHKVLAGADVVLFGELHNNSMAHWLQLVLATQLADRKPLIMGAEMIETDDQEALDRYLRKEIDAVGLDSSARLWKNHPTDYAPLVDLARERGLPFIATNVPRRYASLVYKGGFEALDTLPESEKRWIAPLPIAFDPTVPSYAALLAGMEGHGGANLPKAQALKDATMAWSIMKHWRPGSLFLHFNGAYHSDQHEGIAWYLKREAPALRVVTITTVTAADPRRFDPEWKGRADLVLVVDERVPGSY